MSQTSDFINRLDNCLAGLAGWKIFEDLCIEILCYLLVPPLTIPRIQPRSHSGIDRRDAVFPNRNFNGDSNWALLFQKLEARMILFEFKNYDKEEIGKEEVIQTQSYMKRSMGNLAIMICNKTPNEAAHIKRNAIFTEHKQVILFLTKRNLKEMLYSKERGEDPSDIIIDEEESFYLQHE